MQQLRLHLVIAYCLLSGCGSQPVSRDNTIPLQTVNQVDLDQYLGRWFEIARLPNRFESNCEAVTADYARREDGLISVTNRCRLGAVDGEIKQAQGRARVVDPATNAKLEVSFFGPFWGDYWILDLAPDYSLSIVGEPSGKYLWVLSRTPMLTEDRLQSVLKKLASLGYLTERLYFPKQPPA